MPPLPVGAISRIFGMCSVGCCATVGGAYGYRYTLVKSRRAEINNEERSINERIKEIENKINAAKDEHIININNEEELYEVARVLWEERRNRYIKAGHEAESYAKATPEALSLVGGIQHHIDYMVEFLSKSHKFDTQTHRVQCLLLFLKAGETLGINNVASKIKKYFGEDPTIESICDNVTVHASSNDVPANCKELSKAFTFCFREFYSLLGEAQYRAMSVPERPAAPNLFSHLFGAVLGLMKVPMPSEPEGLSLEDMNQINDMRDDKRQLRTLADIRAAIRYCNHLLKIEYKCHTTGSDLLEDNAQLRVAFQQLSLWKDIAVTFVLQKQAEEALRAHSILLADLMTQERMDGMPQRMSLLRQ